MSQIGSKIKYTLLSQAMQDVRILGERVKDISSESPSVSPPLTSITSMNLLRIAIFKRPPSFPPADKTVIILHLHDKCVCLCTHLCMYVWVLKRTLAAVGHEFSSFISAQKTKRGLFFKCGDRIAVSLLFIWVFIISHCQPESFEVESGARSRCGIVMTPGLCICVCVHLHLYIFPSKSPSFLHFHLNSSKCAAMQRGSSSYNLHSY